MTKTIATEHVYQFGLTHQLTNAQKDVLLDVLTKLSEEGEGRFKCLFWYGKTGEKGLSDFSPATVKALTKEDA